MTKPILCWFAIAAPVLLVTTTTQAQLTPGALYDFQAGNNTGHPNNFTNLGTLAGSLAATGTPPVLTPAAGQDPAYYDVQAADGTFDILSGATGNVIVSDGFSFEIYLRRTGGGFGGVDGMIAAPFEQPGGFKLFLGHRKGAVDSIDMTIFDGSVEEKPEDFATIPLNVWTHVVLTFDEDTDQLSSYVDGGAPTVTQLGEDYDFPAFAANNVTLFKWRGTEGANNRFDGDISAARLYDFELTLEQVQNNCAATHFACLPSITPGDFEDDGDIDIEDYFILRDNLYEHLDGGSVTFFDGDNNIDGKVDLVDFGEFVDLFPGGQAALDAALAAVPEPSSVTLLGFVLAGTAVARRRSHLRRPNQAR